ncbi:MAG: hypothetical protein QRY72_00490 [Candidatus Rhabdochlamydia sp.]
MSCPVFQQHPPSIRVGIDLMGNDTSLYLLLEALLAMDLAPLNTHVFLFAPSSLFKTLSPSFHLVPCEQTVEMTDDPKAAFQTKRSSSLMKGLYSLAQGEIDAFISAGNTGALVLAAKRILPLVPGIERLALAALLPTEKRDVVVLDVGANLTLKPHHAVQLAKMGIAYQRTRNISHPAVGLLNIGIEPTKGTVWHREALLHLSQTLPVSAPFTGNIESQAVFKGDVDVVVTDGLIGNIFLKTAEGVTSFLYSQLLLHPNSSSEISQHTNSVCSHLFLQEGRQALLCGTKKLVIKCHGHLTPTALQSALQSAIRLIKNRFMATFCSHLSSLLSPSDSL